jgi:hypothetical protein
MWKCRLVRPGRYNWLLAESHLTKRLFGSMLRRIWALPLATGCWTPDDPEDRLQPARTHLAFACSGRQIENPELLRFNEVSAVRLE